MENLLISYDPSNDDKIGEVEVSSLEQVQEKVSLAHDAAVDRANNSLI